MTRQRRDVQTTKNAIARVRLVLITAAIALAVSSSAHAATYQTIYTFQGLSPTSTDGGNPDAGLAADAQGRLYGTTEVGGPGDEGTVFRLTPPPSAQGPWSEEILHSFSGPDGGLPEAPVVLGTDGTVYGTTMTGGPYFVAGGAAGRGEVFKLTNTPGWPITILHDFLKTGGGLPTAGLSFGADGLLYGTTPFFTVSGPGGYFSYSAGTAFSVSSLGDQAEYSVIHQFGLGGTQYGPTPLGNVPPGYFSGFVGGTIDSPANTSGLFALKPGPAGTSATLTQLYTFGPLPDVSYPMAPPLAGQGALSGAFYGCAELGGAYNQGGIYKLVPSRTGPATETVIYSFGAQPNDPSPMSYIRSASCALIQGTASGILYGTTAAGGGSGQPAENGGTFFELIPPKPPSTAWTEKVLVSFGNATGGIVPTGNLLKLGNTYYGVTATDTGPSGPNGGPGNVFAITP